MPENGARRPEIEYAYPEKMSEIDREAHRPMSEENAEQCVFYLEETAHAHAAWSARKKYLEKHLTVVLAIEAGKQQSGSATDKDRNAKKSAHYQRMLREYEEAVYHETLLTALRKAADMKFEGWRSLNANHRRGLGA